MPPRVRLSKSSEGRKTKKPSRYGMSTAWRGCFIAVRRGAATCSRRDRVDECHESVSLRYGEQRSMRGRIGRKWTRSSEGLSAGPLSSRRGSGASAISTLLLYLPLLSPGNSGCSLAVGYTPDLRSQDGIISSLVGTVGGS
jgi:hypothetical protein